MSKKSSSILILASLIYIVACSDGTCDSRRDKAAAEIQSVIDTNRMCEKDEDCTSIAFQSNCFDSCTRAVNASGASAVSAAVAKVNATTCANYASDGCTRESPPCAPPTNPKCIAKLCT